MLQDPARRLSETRGARCEDGGGGIGETGTASAARAAFFSFRISHFDVFNLRTYSISSAQTSLPRTAKACFVLVYCTFSDCSDMSSSSSAS